MSQTPSTPSPKAGGQTPNVFSRFMRATEIDPRMLGMVAALMLIWVGFHVFSMDGGAGTFLTPRNLWNLSVQTASVGIMATGMVLVIITRHIDLSVGSILGLCAVVMGVLQTQILPEFMGLGHPLLWVVAALLGMLTGAIIGALQGAIIAFGNVPAFIVTLGGLLVWRGVAYLMTSGKTISPLDPTFTLLGGGPNGAVGATGSWIVGVIACIGIIWMLIHGRQQRRAFEFPLRPKWAEYVLGLMGCGVVIGTVLLVNAYPWPRGIIRRYAEANNIEIPAEGLFISHGFALPVLILAGVTIVMTIMMTRTRFGRYVFAIGGNPDAAALAGINTRWMTVKIFALMGFLCGLSAVVASARLNSATNSLGTLDELYVIAAAVIGGTSLAGGVGTIYGAVLGAFVMQSLQAGMVLVGFDSAMQQIVVGLVLVVAVYLDTLYRRNLK
ncbi:sugar ABC transporter permease [Albirhodobacter sp. R86504]|jgi:D-xylose transport system permease protein|uniref:sugar ABC transporter permease n=1 Tax=Albirhodobacter sp. R86504 TaxID=3093848 RepID=UPI00367036B8